MSQQYTKEQVEELISNMCEKVEDTPDETLSYGPSYLKSYLPYMIHNTQVEWEQNIVNPKPITVEIPIVVKDGKGVLAVDLGFLYDPEQLILTGISKGVDTGDNQPSLVSNFSILGDAKIAYYRTTPLAEGEKEVMVIKGLSTVPNPALNFYKVLINEEDQGEPSPIYINILDETAAAEKKAEEEATANLEQAEKDKAAQDARDKAAQEYQASIQKMLDEQESNNTEDVSPGQSIIQLAIENNAEALKQWITIDTDGNLQGPMADAAKQAIEDEQAKK